MPRRNKKEKQRRTKMMNKPMSHHDDEITK